MLYVPIVVYSVCFNGSSVGPIVPRRGLRQGDSMSPYQFFMCVKGLSKSIINAAVNGSKNGCRICPDSPSIAHLFADDNFLFFKVSS